MLVPLPPEVEAALARARLPRDALSVLVVTPPAPDAERLRALLAELVAVRPLRLVLLRPGCSPAAQFIVSAAHGQEVQP